MCKTSNFQHLGSPIGSISLINLKSVFKIVSFPHFMARYRKSVQMQYHSLLDFTFPESPLSGLHLLHHAPPLVKLCQVIKWRKAGLPSTFGTRPCYHFYLCQACGQTTTWRNSHQRWVKCQLKLRRGRNSGDLWFSKVIKSGHLQQTKYPKSKLPVAGAPRDLPQVVPHTQGCMGLSAFHFPCSRSGLPLCEWVETQNSLHQWKQTRLWSDKNYLPFLSKYATASEKRINSELTLDE